MESLKRRNGVVPVLVAGLVLLAVGSYLLWTLVLDDADDAPTQDDLLADAVATLTIRAATPASTGGPQGASSGAPTPGAFNGVCTPDAFATDFPAGLPLGDVSYPDWYGSREAGLWVAPHDRNSMLRQDLDLPATRWFAGGTTYLMWFGTTEPMQVVGVQLDGDSTFEATDDPVFNPQIEAQRTSFKIPEAGCWSITGRAGERELMIIAEVLPFEARPDVVAAQAVHLLKPDPAPGNCQESPWAGPAEQSDDYTVSYWMEDAATGIAVTERAGWIFAEEDYSLGVTGVDPAEELTAQLRLSAGGSTPLEVTRIQQRNANRIMGVNFPETGCWELVLTAGERTATFVVYAYPAECEPSIVDGRAVSSCPDL